jgi:hypothetical protein
VTDVTKINIEELILGRAAAAAAKKILIFRKNHKNPQLKTQKSSIVKPKYPATVFPQHKK